VKSDVGSCKMLTSVKDTHRRCGWSTDPPSTWWGRDIGQHDDHKSEVVVCVGIEDSDLISHVMIRPNLI
jgi:hypothetical protein